MNKINEFLDLQTCSETRLKKIKNILVKSQGMIGHDLNELQKTDITKFLRTINNSKLKDWTKNDYKKIFKSFIKQAYERDFLEWGKDKNILDGFKGVCKLKAFNKEKINKDTLIKPEELEILLRTSKSTKWKALLTLLYESAFRPCELVNLRWEDLKFGEDFCSVKTISPKTKEMRIIPVQDCVVHLKRWLEEFEFPNRTEKDFVFPNPQDRKKHISEGGLTLLLGRLCKKANIRHIYPYIFRHSRIYFIQKRLGARVSSKYAGHSLETSEIYDHLDSSDVEEAMLEKVFVTKELPPEKKIELEKQIEKQAETMAEMQKFMLKLKTQYDDLAGAVALQETEGKGFGSISDQGMLEPEEDLKVITLRKLKGERK